MLLGMSSDSVIQGLEKTIPDQPKNSTPVHLRQRQIYANRMIIDKPYIPGQKDDAPAS